MTLRKTRSLNLTLRGGSNLLQRTSQKNPRETLRLKMYFLRKKTLNKLRIMILRRYCQIEFAETRYTKFAI